MNKAERNAMLRRKYAQKSAMKRHFDRQVAEGMKVAHEEVPKRNTKEKPCELCSYMIKPGQYYLSQKGEIPWDWIHAKCKPGPNVLTRTKKQQEERERKQRAADPKRYERKAQLEHLKKELLDKDE